VNEPTALPNFSRAKLRILDVPPNLWTTEFLALFSDPIQSGHHPRPDHRASDSVKTYAIGIKAWPRLGGYPHATAPPFAASHPLIVFEPSLLTVLGRTVAMSVGVTLAKIFTLVGSSVPRLTGEMVDAALTHTIGS
jgi:hypothetical protein